MKKINRQIRSILFEMVILIGFIIISFNVWNSFNYDEVAKIAYAYSNYSSDLILKVNNNLDSNDNNILNDYNLSVSILNINKVAKSYNLYIRYNNINNTLNKDYLKIDYLGESYYLNELDSFTRGNYTYYKIKSDVVKKKNTNTIDMNVYLSDNYPFDTFTKTGVIDFYIEEI